MSTKVLWNDDVDYDKGYTLTTGLGAGMMHIQKPSTHIKVDPIHDAIALTLPLEYKSV